MAAALARAQGLDAESAGLDPPAGRHAAPNAVRVLRDARGLDLSDHTPQAVDDVSLSAFDRIVAVTPTVARRLRTEHAIPNARLVVWSIPDPYGGSQADYRWCLEQIALALDDLLTR
jgi:protein-tyrosine-phosphatase